MEVQIMELEILRKKLNTYRTGKGRLTKVPDELAYEMLLSWEQWTGPARGFYSALEVDHRKVAGILGRAKKLKREGAFPDEIFKEIKVSAEPVEACTAPIIMKWERGRIIKFTEVNQLVDFLNTMEKQKAA